MSDPMHFPLNDGDRQAEPPLVDSLHYERDADGFSVLFVPSDGDDAKRDIFVPRDSTEGREIAAFLYRIQALIRNRVDKVTHGGGADYTLRLAGGEILDLSDEAPNEAWVPEVFDRLKQIAVVAETAFNLAHAAQR